MRGTPLLLIFLALLVIPELFNGATASTDEPGLRQSDNSMLRVMANKSSSDVVSGVEEYLNRTRIEEVSVIIYPSDPWESRRLWQESTSGKLNDSLYLGMMELIWAQYLDDLNYSSYILDEFVKNKINGRESMDSTMTLFVMTSQTVDMLDQIKPPAKHAQYHNDTLNALVNLEGYLWNMAKFYETNRRVYAVQAHDNFNRSMSYYEKVSK